MMGRNRQFTTTLTLINSFSTRARKEWGIGCGDGGMGDGDGEWGMGGWDEDGGLLP